MPSSIVPWRRPAFRPTGRRASVHLLAFAGADLTGGGLHVRDAVPDGAPVDALALTVHRRAEAPEWFDGWRDGGLRAVAVLDTHAIRWHSGPAVAALAPDRPFAVGQEVSLTAETEPSPGFGHPVHTRGLRKVGRPDLVAGVPAERIEDTGRLLNHLAGMLADGHVLTPGQRLRLNGDRGVTVAPYTPDGVIPELNLNNDALLLVVDD